MKCLGPWIPGHTDKTGGTTSYYRRLLGQDSGYYVFQQHGEWMSFGSGRYPTKEQAMAARDALLIEDGWTLLTQEQWDKLRVLL